MKSGSAARGVGFDIAENQISFANEKAKELNLPCEFVAANVYDIDDSHKEEFDYDISGGFSDIDCTGFPLSMIVQGKKQ